MTIVRSNRLPVKHPGIVIKERYMGSDNLTEASESLSISRKELSSFIGGKRPATIELAKQLEQITGVSLEFWMNRQKKSESYISNDIK